MEHCQVWWDLKEVNPDAAFEYYKKHLYQIHSHIREWIELRDKTFYYYLVTFTMKPGLKPKQVSEAEAYIERQFTDRPALQVAEAYIVKEFTQAGVPHWHVSVKTGVPLSKDRFNYYERIYGKTDISRNKQQSLLEGMEYISKSNTPKKLI